MIQKLSISSIKQFKACRRAYQLRKIYNVYPIKTTEALQTGSRYHELIEEMTKTGIIPEVTDKESAMAAAYAKYIMPQMPPFDPEVWFEKPIGRGKRLIGRADGVAHNAIIEHKTTAISPDEYEMGLERDEQLLAYFIAFKCNTAYYTICRKPTIRQKANETDEEFAQRCFEWYDEDTFDKIRMIKVTRTDEEISEYQKHLNKMFGVIRSAAKCGSFYRNTANCRAYGTLCEYAPICMHYDPDENYVGFERRENDVDHKH